MNQGRFMCSTWQGKHIDGPESLARAAKRGLSDLREQFFEFVQVETISDPWGIKVVFCKTLT